MRENNKVARLIPFIDVFLILLIVALALVNPPNEDGKITPRAEAMLTAEWDADIDNDVDIWVMAPNGDIISFRKRDGTHMILRRDDRGISSDIYGSYNEDLIDQNIENVDFMKLLDGTYIVNVDMYSFRDREPTEVHLILFEMNPFKKTVDTTTTLTAMGQELTSFEFTVKDGVIVSTDTDIQVGTRMAR